jgi:ferritin
MTVISKEMNERLNAQIAEELSSAYIYLGMSTWAEEKSLHHLANWMSLQAKEEFSHAKKFWDFIIETGGSVKFAEIPKARTDYADVESLIKTTIGHEEYITKKITTIMDFAQETKDYVTIGILMWFIKEQVEEEANAKELLTTYELQGKRNGLWDHHLKRES